MRSSLNESPANFLQESSACAILFSYTEGDYAFDSRYENCIQLAVKYRVLNSDLVLAGKIEYDTTFNSPVKLILTIYTVYTTKCIGCPLLLFQERIGKRFPNVPLIIRDGRKEMEKD